MLRRPLEAVHTVNLLTLDSFGAQSDTARARAKLYQLVNCRMHQGAQQPAHSGHVQLTEREFALHYGPIASNLKTAVHVCISAPDSRERIMRGATPKLHLHMLCLYGSPGRAVSPAGKRQC